MHHLHTETILMAVAIERVAQEHHLSEAQLYDRLHELRPLANDQLLRGAAILALGTKTAIGQLFIGACTIPFPKLPPAC